MIDLRSDTVTQPTLKMRQAMFDAEVGDDVYDDDPTIKSLEAYSAELFGKEAALYVPSGTFGNQLCILTQTRRGDEIILSDDSHILCHEVGAAAVIAGVQIRPLSCFGGRFDMEQLENTIRTDDIHYPDTGLICIENAHGNGSVMPLENMKEIYELGQKHGIPVHLDGARVFNAAAALNASPKSLGQYCDTLTFCLSKGLCAPVGSMVIGTKAFIEKAKRNRKLMGGGLRQAGFLAAAGLVALRDMVEELPKDHKKADLLANGLKEIDGLSVLESRRDINMVFFTLDDKNIDEDVVIEAMLKEGIKINGTEDNEWRFVTHHWILEEDIPNIVETFKKVLSS